MTRSLEAIVGGIGTIFGGISIAIVFYFHTKDFEEEYRKKNNLVISNLVREYNDILDRLDSPRKSASTDDDYIKLRPQIEGSYKKAGEILKWQSHIRDGRNALRKLSYYIVLVSVLIGLALIVGSLLTGLAQEGVVIASLYGIFLTLPSAVKHSKVFFGIIKEIDERTPF
jgi:glutaredoxin 2